jgi:glucose/arabinose dehydrogenase
MGTLRSIAIISLLAWGIASETNAQLTAATHATGFSLPVAFVQDPTDRTVQYVVEQRGRIRVVRNGTVLATDFLNLTAFVSNGSEQGLLGLAFAPDYATSGRFYVNFTNKIAVGDTVVARFRRSSNPLVADLTSRFDLRWGGPTGPAFITQPYANHNGGNLVFGPDGFLYIGLGDGGSGNDPEHRAQNPSELLGKMLRIDVNVPDTDLSGYQVPPSNPFLGGQPPGVRPEIWSFGLRNPWRYSFDDPTRGGTGALVIGDVGQGSWEEIDYEPSGRRGRNYGWRNREGAHDNVISLPVGYFPLTDPIHEYDHSTGQSVTGGFVYRGRALGATYQGRYFFADFVQGRVWSIALTINSTGEATASNRLEHTAELGGSTLGNISSFGVDGDGELYIVGYSQGRIVKILGIPVAPTITLQPANQAAVTFQNAQFTVAANGVPIPDYQWQVSTNAGSSWTNLTNTPPYSGVTTATLTVDASAPLNGYQFRCVVSNSAGSVTSAAATLAITAITLTPFWPHFGATKAGASGALVTVTPAQDVTVGFTGASSSWTATADQPWVQITNGSGSGTGRFNVAIVNPNNVIGGSSSLAATITVTAAGVGASTATPVTLSVQQAATSAGPFGSFDTPVNGTAGISGSIAVTGWALDDIGIDRIEIWRDLVAGETTPPFMGAGPGRGKVFIATPLFIAGARPDVEAAFPVTPLNYRAGWGYLLLTWGLWNQGNGTYTLYAFAFDKEGNSTTLGTKTITVDNAHANKPFGSLDTPTFGQSVSSSFWNYGWALTPGSCAIVNGGVQMAIDSGPLVPVNYGDLRPDVGAGFTGFTNSASAGGAFFVDVSTLAVGTHSIGWLVTDNCGRRDGIGSRFFTVTAASGAGSSGWSTADTAMAASPSPLPSSIRTRVNWDLVGVRRNDGEPTWVAPTSAGTRIIEVAEGARLAVQLPAIRDAAYSGYQLVNHRQRPLPLGSSLDAASRIFYWQPAAGFLGAFDLVFTATRGEHAETVSVRVVVGPSLRMAVDLPAPSTTVAQPFWVAGWALDLAAIEGTGVDTVHVWAYSSDGANPVFLGVAAYGDARTDVTATYGLRFEHTAYHLLVNQLRPGTYDVVVYAHRASTGRFDGAQIVRVIVR